MPQEHRCRYCRGIVNTLDINCPHCGRPIRAADPRLCPFCGRLKNQLYDVCVYCADSYQPPKPRIAPEPEPKPSPPTGICPKCEYRRPLNGKPCPWCNSHLPPIRTSGDE